MKQVFNPYLPAGEYIPDGEPHVFGNRVYVYGSHDRFNAAIFCVNDYVCYSAPVDDLSAWRYEGVIYKKKQDPLNKLGIRLLFAPDVVQGVDGRYYLYYAYDFLGRMGVAFQQIAKRDLLLRVSELDVGIDDTSEENLQKQAKYYGNLMKIFLRYADRIEAVQVWGTVDDLSWRADEYPLLFDKDAQPKPAFDTLVELAQ